MLVADLHNDKVQLDRSSIRTCYGYTIVTVQLVIYQHIHISAVNELVVKSVGAAKLFQCCKT